MKARLKYMAIFKINNFSHQQYTNCLSLKDDYEGLKPTLKLAENMDFLL